MTTQWGRWTLDTRLNVLRHEEIPGYEVDLYRMETSAAMLDWIFQVTGKNWVTRQDAGYLIEALRELRNPQRYLCLWGIEQSKETALTKADIDAALAARGKTDG